MIETLGHATVDFLDCSSEWRETGELELIDGHTYVLHVDQRHGGGTRVFPLPGRRAEVYLDGAEDAIVVEGGPFAAKR